MEMKEFMVENFKKEISDRDFPFNIYFSNNAEYIKPKFVLSKSMSPRYVNEQTLVYSNGYMTNISMLVSPDKYNHLMYYLMSDKVMEDYDKFIEEGRSCYLE